MSTLERLQEIIVKVMDTDELPSPEKTLEQLGGDSLDLTEICFFIENEFELDLLNKDELVERGLHLSIKDLAESLDQKLVARA